MKLHAHTSSPAAGVEARTAVTVLDSDLNWKATPPTLADGSAEPKPLFPPASTRFIPVGGLVNLYVLGYRTDQAIVSPAPRLFALVIGINKYRLRIPKDRIANLRNKQATRNAIETEIKKLGDNPAIQKGDPILIFYAGHGAEAKAPSGWTTSNGKIQMLLPYDFSIRHWLKWSKQGQGVLDVMLSRLLSDLAEKKSDNITVIFDCCYSGSGTRADDNEFDFRSCRSEQVAWEEDGHSAFTSALLALLQEQSFDKLTYEKLMAQLSLPKDQQPQCEGVHQSRLIFNPEVIRPQREIYSIRASESGHPNQYILEAGAAHGIKKKAMFTVFTDKTMTSTIGTVVAPFILDRPAYALQTVGTGQDVSFFIEPDERLLKVWQLVSMETQRNKAGKRGFGLVEKHSDADLVIAADGDFVHFEIMDEPCRNHGLKRMPFSVKIDDLDTIYRVLQSSADFYSHLHSSSEMNPLAEKVEFECTKLTEIGNYSDDLDEILKPDDGLNLNIEGVISVDVDEEAMYGFKVINKSPVALYVSMFYFDVSDLSISPYYLPGSAQKDIDAPLPAKGSLDIGYGASGTIPHTYIVRQGQDVDVGFLKLGFSTTHRDWSGIVQSSPFEYYRPLSTDERAKGFKLSQTMVVAIVQKKKRACVVIT
ncbi:hypothetical protein IW262DRAFT_1459230 [Armillaria fumosa]|nr:hypothetical protein IW262DRAFT_1459230 [Armillaria fumosa]